MRTIWKKNVQKLKLKIEVCDKCEKYKLTKENWKYNYVRNINSQKSNLEICEKYSFAKVKI